MTERSLLEKVAEQVQELINLLNGKPFDPKDTGMKGKLLSVLAELENFDAVEFRANTEFRKRKEREWSKITLQIINTAITVLVTLAITKIIGG